MDAARLLRLPPLAFAGCRPTPPAAARHRRQPLDLSRAIHRVPLIDPIFYSATGVTTELYLFSLAEELQNCTMADNCEWMYSGWKRGRPPTDEWIERTKEFLDRAFSNPSLAADGQVKCPCSLCRNFARHKRQTIEMHLCREGFKENYSSWTAHGEGPDGHVQDNVSAIGEGLEEVDHMDDMLCDMADGYQLSEQEPTASAQAFYKMVASADEPVHSETQHSRLSTIARLLSIKSQYNMPAGCYDDVMKLIHELLPAGSKLDEDFYHSKKTLEGLGILSIRLLLDWFTCGHHFDVAKT
ncbi:hypothetical protein ACP70R_009090 [Stipagrostis hirtigluma subsp. patula]